MLYKSGQYVEALKHIELAENLNPENSEILAIKGNILYKQYRHEDAILIQKKLLKRHPKNYSLLNNIGNIKREKGLLEERSEEGRVGKEGVSTCKVEWWP